MVFHGNFARLQCDYNIIMPCLGIVPSPSEAQLTTFVTCVALSAEPDVAEAVVAEACWHDRISRHSGLNSIVLHASTT